MDDEGKPQLFYDVSIAYDTDEGKMQLPVGGYPVGNNSRASLIVDLYMPVTTVVVTWTCGRIGRKPSPPSPTPVDPNWVLLRARPCPVPAQFMADDQSRAYFISGIYEYAAIEPIDVTVSQITMANLPFDLNPASENRYNPSDFTQTVLDPDRTFDGSGKPIVNPKWGQATGFPGKPVVFP